MSSKLYYRMCVTRSGGAIWWMFTE